MSGKPLVRIVATGGTIANTVGGRIAVDDVLRDVPQVGEHARIEIEEVTRVGSRDLGPNDWLKIAAAVQRAVRDPNAVGVVVTHGTFSSEETSYFLNLTVETDKPVVVACSQRKHGTLGNDGDHNLVSAVRTALAPQARGMGVFVLLNEDIHCAREVVKVSARPDGFKSRDVGPLGHADTDRITFYRAPVRRHTAASEFRIEQITELPRVDIVAGYAGADGAAARGCVAAGAKGLIVAGFAFNGAPAPVQRAELEQIVAGGIPVVCVNRGLEGRVPVDPSDPFIQGDNLAPQKARILLMLGLTKTTHRSELQRLFDEY